MSVKIKINGATPKTGKSICLSCKSASVVRGQNMEEKIVCDAGMWHESKGVVNFKVAECSDYHPVNMPWLREMEAMAWKIEARKRGPTGFAKAGSIPQEGDKNEMEVTVEPPKRRDPLDDYPDF